MTAKESMPTIGKKRTHGIYYHCMWGVIIGVSVILLLSMLGSFLALKFENPDSLVGIIAPASVFFGTLSAALFGGIRNSGNRFSASLICGGIILLILVLLASLSDNGEYSVGERIAIPVAAVAATVLSAGILSGYKVDGKKRLRNLRK